MSESERASGGLQGGMTLILSLIAIASNGVALYVAFQQAASAREDAQQTKDFSAIKLYLDTFNRDNSKDHFCDNRANILLFAKTLQNYASSIADTISKDYSSRVVKCQQARNEDAAAGSDAIGLQYNASSSYAAQNVVNRGVADAAPSVDINAQNFLKGFTIFIQYADSSMAQAQKYQADISAAGGNAPGLEKVSANVSGTQIRIYKAQQKEIAGKLAKLLSPSDPDKVRIVNLQSAYPNLPADRMEVWVGASHT